MKCEVPMKQLGGAPNHQQQQTAEVRTRHLLRPHFQIS
ncbi:hypothetical protein Cadr_000026939 [Camelus dromedarius]|uniref:Uncharacterized protein n=1 Tax=Camelus dromedarius TaxID=9838 RepID=A0A5N4C6Y7_CAMDR|nr:hypothetical protein Cadr_000026939 [Camelus dromedarius]